MYQLGYYLESKPSVIYPSFVQAACARFGGDTIRVSQDIRGHFLRKFDTVDDLVGDILYNSHRSVSFEAFFHTEDPSHSEDWPLFTVKDPMIPVQWILDNAYRLEFSDATAVSTPKKCDYTVYGIDDEYGQEWSLKLEVKYS